MKTSVSCAFRGRLRRSSALAGAFAAISFALVLTACSSGAGTGSGSGTPGGPASADRIATALDGFVQNGLIPGYGFVVVRADGSGNVSTLFQRVDGTYSGLAGAPDVSLTQPTLLASASKSLAAAAILTLVDAGKLSLDVPVATYLAADGVTWPVGKVGITLQMLLNHTSGLPGILSANQPACIDVRNTNAANSESLQQCVQDIANSTLDALPGSTFIYGGADYQVAGFIAMKAAGYADWSSFFHAALAGPLGATTMAYAPASGALAQINPRVAGGAVSSVTDYATFLTMLLNGGMYQGRQILSPATVALLQSDQLPAGMQVAPPAGADASAFNGYSFGFFQDAPSIYPGSPGPEFSDQGLFGETPWIDYGLHYAAVLLINGTASNGLATGTSMWNAIHADVIALAKGQ